MSTIHRNRVPLDLQGWVRIPRKPAQRSGLMDLNFVKDTNVLPDFRVSSSIVTNDGGQEGHGEGCGIMTGDVRP